jgi:hypothetical protein
MYECRAAPKHHPCQGHTHGVNLSSQRTLLPLSLSCISLVLSFFHPSPRLAVLCRGPGGNTCASRGVGLQCKYSKVDWESLQTTRCAHAHPNVCMRRLRTVVRRPNLDHQTQLAVERASQHASRSPADSTVLLPRRGPFGWHTHLRLPSASRASKPSLFHLAVKATTTH